MKKISITYFRPDQITLLSNMIGSMSKDFIEHVYSGYSCTVVSNSTAPDEAYIQVWNILRDDVEKFGSELDKYIMDIALKIPGPDRLKLMIEDDPECIKCKFINVLDIAMGSLDVDEAELVWVGPYGSDIDWIGSIPNLIVSSILESDEFEGISDTEYYDGKYHFYVRKCKKE